MNGFDQESMHPNEVNQITLTKSPEEATSITFKVDSENWIMKIQKTENGPIVRFNTEDYPKALPDDFARAVVKVLCAVGSIKSFLENAL